jgi:hypothetical protein
MEEFQNVDVVRFVLEMDLKQLIYASFQKRSIVQGNTGIRHQVRCEIPARLAPPRVGLLHGILGHQQ